MNSFTKFKRTLRVDLPLSNYGSQNIRGEKFMQYWSIIHPILTKGTTTSHYYSGFLLVFRFPPPIKLIVTILLKYC